jgi:NadR type nicotinamide-nucleotide adenylyltransferase
MKSELIRIAFIGPESTGKTSLCIELAKHYNTVWVPEYSREYIEKLNRPYTRDDVIFCAEKQIDLENELSKKANKILFVDTELINYHVWMLDVFKESTEWIEEKIKHYKYDLYLLTKTDIPFTHDPVRENPHRRDFFFEWYEKELTTRGLPFVMIEGTGERRLKSVINIIGKKFFSYL